MAKVTSKLQITIPKRLAEEYSIAPGDEINWAAAGDAIRIIPTGRHPEPLGIEERLRLFDQASARQEERQLMDGGLAGTRQVAERGWSREQLYGRDRIS